MIKSMFNSGMTYLEISEKIGRTIKSVRIKLNGMGIFQSKRAKKERESLVYEKIICLNCGKTFEAYKRNKQKFCSQSCNASFNNSRREIEGGKQKNAICIECGKETEVSVYVSNSKVKCKLCNPKFGEPNKYKRDVKRINGKFICLSCGVELTKKGKYCSRGCQIKLDKKKIFEKIETGDITLPQRYYKKYLIEKYGEKCMECGWNKKNPKSNKIPIELEHTDGHSENNKLENLKLLCPSCHSLTPTYGSLNAGNGRYKRRQRYQEGKSS